MSNSLTDLEFSPGVNVSSFFVSVTFFPEMIQNKKSNDLFLNVVSAINDLLDENESLVRWSVQSIRDNLFNHETAEQR
jgi:hypothetical protein